MKKHYLFFVALILISQACNPIYYRAGTQNVPLFSNKNSLSLNVAGSGQQAEIQGAYSFSDHWAVQLNSGLFFPKDETNGNGGSGAFLEPGIGYFKPINGRLIWEAYGLFGMGIVENHLPSTIAANPQTTGDISGRLYRFGLQTNFGYKLKYLEVAISSKFMQLKFNNVRGNLIFDNVNQIQFLKDNNSYFLIEPALTLRGGIEKIKLQFQLGWSLNITDPDFRQDKSFASLGIHFRL